MTPEELKAIQDRVSEELKTRFEKQDGELKSAVEAKVNAAVEQLQKGMISKDDYQKMISDALKEYGEKATKIEEILRDQGDKINGLQESIKTNKTGLTDIKELIEPHIPKLKELYQAGTGFIKISLKAAGVTSIANGIQAMTSPPNSPYAPGISNQPLTLYDIIRNPAFVSNYVNMGYTDQSRLAWINETSLQGLPALVAEAGSKPLTQRTFQVEYSQAKKIAAYISLTEEFDKDLPYLSTAVRRMLQMDLVRAFDLQIQADVISSATQLSFTTQLGPNNLTLAPLKNQIFDATLWDGLFAMGTAVRLANFIPNVSLVNPITYAKLVMSKDTYGRYNIPPAELSNQVNPQQGNNVTADWSLVGDLKQFNTDIYEDFVLKMGWINDDLIKNQFTIVSEVRFHDYISNARKQAIMYANCKWIAEQLNGGSAFPIGS